MNLPAGTIFSFNNNTLAIDLESLGSNEVNS